ncbi:hypothetical protein EVG20_g8219 [Dentipellis fragilis]|uniref:Uncharacterized protein n=1 Tax=Dentipellis fragilis TaxID=205917 RepID=A0A4Y9Y7D9_9AGAM|nr:hypothetical protein EVG20_g8219 [Dentipellis fragilis]
MVTAVHRFAATVNVLTPGDPGDSDLSAQAAVWPHGDTAFCATGPNVDVCSPSSAHPPCPRRRSRIPHRRRSWIRRGDTIVHGLGAGKR